MLPKRVQKNQPITADLLNNIIDSIRECQIQSGVGYSFNRTSGGTTLSVKTGGAAGGVSIILAYPFQFYAGGTASAPWCGLHPGTINGLVPTNITSTFGLPTSLTYTKYLVLDCTTDGYKVTEATVALEDSPPAPPEPTIGLASPSFKILTHVILNGAAYRTMGPSSIVAVPQEILRTDKASVSYGEIPFDVWYAWVFAS